jgi:hypothetical protein
MALKARDFSLQTPDDFRERVAECERQATKARSPTVRETLVFVARRWRELAAEDEGHRPPNRWEGDQQSIGG